MIPGSKHKIGKNSRINTSCIHKNNCWLVKLHMRFTDGFPSNRLVTLHGTGNGTSTGNGIRTTETIGPSVKKWTFLHDILEPIDPAVPVPTQFSYSTNKPLFWNRRGNVHTARVSYRTTQEQFTNTRWKRTGWWGPNIGKHDPLLVTIVTHSNHFVSRW